MERSRDRAVRELFASQHGVAARRQLRAMGMTPKELHRRLATGVFAAESSRVLRLAGAPSTVLSRQMAAVLDTGPGAVISHRTAAARWGLDGFEGDPLEVTGLRPRVSHGRHPLALVHQPRRLLAAHCVELDGIPVTTPTRTVFDLAGARRMHPRRTERILDSLWAKGLVSHASLQRMLSELAKRGRPGIALMRALLDERPVDYRPAGSSLERRFQEIVRRFGFHDFQRQIDVGDDDNWIGRVDFLDRGRRIVVEVDPAPYHTSLTDRQKDAERHAALASAGWSVVSVTDDDLFQRPSLLRERLVAATRRAA